MAALPERGAEFYGVSSGVRERYTSQISSEQIGTQAS
jgi:hypothetical protein